MNVNELIKDLTILKEWGYGEQEVFDYDNPDYILQKARVFDNTDSKFDSSDDNIICIEFKMKED
jgi:hypothetical protein